MSQDVPKHRQTPSAFQQEKARTTLLDYLRRRDIWNLQRALRPSRVPTEVLKDPEIQAQAMSAIREQVDYLIHAGKNTSVQEGHAQIIHFLETAFHIPASEIRTDQVLHRMIKSSFLQRIHDIGRYHGHGEEATVWEIIQSAQTVLALSQEWFHDQELQRAAEHKMRQLVVDFFSQIKNPVLDPGNETVLSLKWLEQDFGVSLRSVCAEPKIRGDIEQKVAEDFLHIDGMDRFIAGLQCYEVLETVVREIVKSSHEVQDALVSGIIFAANGSVGFWKEDVNNKNGASIKKAVEYFQLDEYVKEALQAWAEKMVRDGVIEPLRFIAKLGFLPPDFFSRPEFIPYLKQILIQRLVIGDHWYVKTLAHELGLSSAMLAMVDDAASEDTPALSGALMEFIPSLGSAALKKNFPKTFESVTQLLAPRLYEAPYLADYFIENLDSYYQQPWVPDCLALALTHGLAGERFLLALQQHTEPWVDEPWVPAAAETAKQFAAVQPSADKPHASQADDSRSWAEDEDHDREGLSTEDPYEHDPLRLSAQQIRVSSALADLMAGKKIDAEAQALNLDVAELKPVLTEVNARADREYQDFIDLIRTNSALNEDDRQALLAPDQFSVRTIPLLDNVRAFVARYLVQTHALNHTEDTLIVTIRQALERGDLAGLLAEGFKRYIKIHEVDIPLYDRLYEEFDALRETGRHPLEVYLGRDGIYAWIGRRAQDLARRRKMGFKERKRLKQAGEVFAIHPKYMVYPSYFRDNINSATKRKFLEQEGISPEADPLFYDTGYQGSIPEQIMRIMDFAPEEIERRIRLLSAKSDHRRAKGLSENAADAVIQYIEDNAKTEWSARGLIRDKRTDKIRPFAQPTSPEEQYYYAMIKQALARHYWIKERVHHQPGLRT